MRHDLQYRRQLSVSLPRPTTANIMGLPVVLFSPDETLAQIVQAINRSERLLIGHVNAHAFNLVAHSPKLSAFFTQHADWVLCDGFGVRLAARLLGQPLPPRHTLPDWLPRLCDTAVHREFSLFLLGAQPGVAAQAAEHLQAAHSGLKIVGTQHGYFDQRPGSPDCRAILETINQAQPDILLVGLGMPLQEYWLMENWPHLAVKVALTGGAIFDYASGALPRPPRWMCDHGLEWLGRLLIEPRRLWRRYLIGLPAFAGHILRYRNAGSRVVE